jgi:hypothetical protein
MIKEWILDDCLVKINGIEFCGEEERMDQALRKIKIHSVVLKTIHVDNICQIGTLM